MLGHRITQPTLHLLADYCIHNCNFLTPCGCVGLDKVERPGCEIPEAQPGPRDAHHQVRALAENQLPGKERVTILGHFELQCDTSHCSVGSVDMITRVAF